MCYVTSNNSKNGKQQNLLRCAIAYSADGEGVGIYDAVIGQEAQAPASYRPVIGFVTCCVVFADL